MQYDNYGFQRLFDIAHYPVSWQNDFYHKNLLFVSHIIPFIATVKSSCDAMFLFSILYALTVHLLKCKQYFTNLFIISASQKKFWGYGFIFFFLLHLIQSRIYNSDISSIDRWNLSNCLSNIDSKHRCLDCNQYISSSLSKNEKASDHNYKHNDYKKDVLHHHHLCSFEYMFRYFIEIEN